MNKVYNYYIRLEFLLCALIVIFIILEKIPLVSLCFSITFIILFVTLIYHLFYLKKNNLLLLIFILIIISTLNVFINLIYSSFSILLDFNYFSKMIMFFTTIFSFYIIMIFNVDKKSHLFISWIPVIIGCLLIYSYYFGNNTYIFKNGITLGFHNPNFTAMWLIHLFCYGIYCLFNTTKLYLKIFCIVYSIVIVNLIMLTNARACIGGLFCLGVFLLYGYLKKNYKLFNISIFIIILLPLIFAVVYMHFSYYLMFSSDFDFVVSEGKGIMSRFGMWSLAFTHFIEYWWTGDYFGISDGTGLSQMHNTHLDVLASYGIIPFILFIVFLFSVLKKINYKISKIPNYIALVSFLTIVLIGTFEAGLVSGCTGLNFLTSGFLLLAKEENCV